MMTVCTGRLDTRASASAIGNFVRSMTSTPRARYRLADQIVVDLFRLASPSDERDVTRIGQKRQCGPHRAFHVEAGRENRETRRRLQVAHATLVQPTDNHGGTRPELVTRAKNELE